MFERHSRLTGAILALLSLLITDLAGTAFLNAWRTSRRTRQAPPIPSHVFHHGYGPLGSGVSDWGPRRYPFFTNSLGFVDGQARVVDLQAHPCMVFIGDSFTEGKGVAYPQSFVGRIDAALAPRGVTVLNAGVMSYSPIIYYRKLRFFIENRGLAPDTVVVFLDISDVQDELFYRSDDRGYVVWDESRRDAEVEANKRHGGEPRPEGSIGLFLRQHTLALNRAYQLFRRLAGWQGTPTGRRRALWTSEERFFEEYGREGLRKAARHMDQLWQLLSERHARLVVAIYPWPDQIVRRELGSRQQAFWSEWCRRRDVDLLDYFPRFIGSMPPEQALRRFFIPGDVHWNEEGHRFMADGFLDWYSAH